MNEAGFSMRAGLFSLNAYFFISFAVLQTLIGEYGDAVNHANTFGSTPRKDVANEVYAPPVEKPSIAESDDYVIIT